MLTSTSNFHTILHQRRRAAAPTMREAAPMNVEAVVNAVKRATIKGGLLATAIFGGSSGLLGGAGVTAPWAQPGAYIIIQT